MKKLLQNQNGSVVVLALITMIFLSIILSGIVPLVNTQVLTSSMNNDVVEAQYAAEAGAKRAIVGIRNNRTDWTWAIGNPHNTFVDGTTKYYTTSIRPLIADTDIPATNTTYTITSNGYVGNAQAQVVVIVNTPSMAGGPFQYAGFSAGNMLIQNPLITGDIYSNANIKTTSNKNMVIGTAYSQTQSIENPSNVTQGHTVTTDSLELDVDALMPAMPSLSMIGTNLKTSGITSLTSGSYYYDGNYGMYSKDYSVVSGSSVTIYVKGDFNIGKNITGGNITIYATGDITFNGGSVQAASGGTVNIYANKVLTLNNGSSITGSTVTVLANNASNSSKAMAFNGGSINSTLSDSVSKVYANGNVALNNVSVIAGQGTGMLVSTGAVDLNGGTAANTIVIAGGNVKGSSGSKVAGIYTNGTLTMVGTSITYRNDVIESLGLSSGIPTPFTVVSWGAN